MNSRIPLTLVRYILRVGVVLLGATLSGCGEVLNEYYISNHTDTDLTVRMTPFYTDTVDLTAGPLIEDLQTSARSSLNEPLPSVQNEEVTEFTVPMKSTVYLGFSSGGNELFSQIEITAGEQIYSMDHDDYRDYFAIHDRLIGAIVQVFNVQ